MKTRLALCTLALLPGLAWAGHNPDVDRLARETGLTCAEVQMVLGARTVWPEYMTSYARSERRMEAVLGAERLRDLMAGRPIRLDDGTRIALAVAVR